MRGTDIDLLLLAAGQRDLETLDGPGTAAVAHEAIRTSVRVPYLEHAHREPSQARRGVIRTCLVCGASRRQPPITRSMHVWSPFPHPGVLVRPRRACPTIGVTGQA